MGMVLGNPIRPIPYPLMEQDDNRCSELQSEYELNKYLPEEKKPHSSLKPSIINIQKFRSRMSFSLISPTSPLLQLNTAVNLKPPSLPTRARLGRDFRVKAFFFDPTEKPILKEALKEPVAFMGGMFAGLLRLDLNEDPLREWVSRTVEASGFTEEEINSDRSNSNAEEEVPQQIEIE